jgi:hypothetical protein
MSENRRIIAYLYKNEWYTAEQVEKARVSDKGAYMDAHPYSVASLRNRREYGRDVPTWIDIDEPGQTNSPNG